MPMNRTERETIENIIRRLKKPNCGSSSFREEQIADALRAIGMKPEPGEYETCVDQLAIVPRIYLDTWIIPALEMVLTDSAYNKNVARDLSR